MATGYFGYAPAEGETDADMARRHAEVFLDVLERRGLRRAEPAADVPQPARPAAARAAFGGPARADLVGRRLQRRPPSGPPSSGMNLQSSTLLIEDTGASRSTSSRPSRSAPTATAWEEAGHARDAARVGQPQRSSRSSTTATAPTSARRRQPGPVRLSSTTMRGALRPHLRRRARPADRAARRATRRSPRPTRCCSPCPTSSASTTTPTSSSPSSTHVAPALGWR